MALILPLFPRGETAPTPAPTPAPATGSLWRPPAQSLPPMPPQGDLLAALDAHTWANLDIPPETRFLGDLITDTSRVFIVGGTGLGKTQIAHAMAAGIATGEGFLHWRCDRPARVLLIDGEMSRSLIKDRIGSAIRRATAAVPSGNLAVYALDRSEDFAKQFPGLGLFEPLNTTPGHDFIKRLIGTAKPDVVIFDNVMSLITGDQKDEVPWSETLPLVAWITARGIGQVWLDHTGHDRSRQYGSATKAWRFDAVGIMGLPANAEPAPGETVFCLSFDAPGKARRRAPSNWQDFAPHVISLKDDRWTAQAVDPSSGRPTGSAPGEVRPSAGEVFLALLARFEASGVRVSASPNSPSHAPKLFAASPDARGYSRRQLDEAMRALLVSGKVHLVAYGKPSAGTRELRIKPDAAPSDDGVS